MTTDPGSRSAAAGVAFQHRKFKYFEKVRFGIKALLIEVFFRRDALKIDPAMRYALPTRFPENRPASPLRERTRQSSKRVRYTTLGLIL